MALSALANPQVMQNAPATGGVFYTRYTGDVNNPVQYVDQSGNVLPMGGSVLQQGDFNYNDGSPIYTNPFTGMQQSNSLSIAPGWKQAPGFVTPGGQYIDTTRMPLDQVSGILQSIPGAGSVSMADTGPLDNAIREYGPILSMIGVGGFAGLAAAGAAGADAAATAGTAAGGTDAIGALGAGGGDALAAGSDTALSGLGGAGAGGAAGAGGYDLTGNLANLATNPANVQVAGDATGIGGVGAAGDGTAGELAAQQAAAGASGAGGAGSVGAIDTIGVGGDGLAGAGGIAANGGIGATAAGAGAAGAGLIDTLGVGGDGLAGPGGVAANGGVGATTGGVGGAAGGTALSRILNGTGTAADYAQIGLQAAPGLLGAYGSSQQAGALSNLANTYMNIGAPSRARYEAAMTPGFDPTTIPGYSGALASSSQAMLSKLSATGGNPYGNPGGLISANQQIVNGTALPAIQNYESQNAATGGYANFNASVPSAATGAIGAQGGVLSALGSAASSVVNPPQTLADLLKQYGLGSAANNSNTLSSGASLQ